MFSGKSTFKEITMFFTGKSKKPGLSPGTLVYVGEKREEDVKISVIDYDPDHLEEKEVQTLDECTAYKDKESVTWINVSGIHDMGIIEALGKRFDFHPLLLEDVVNTEHRPKLDDYEDHLFVVMKMLHDPEEGQLIKHEQISIILTPKVVISLQENEGDIFDPVRERIRKKKGRIRNKGTDYLTYALIDTLVDYYFKVFETVGEKIEALQAEVLENPRPELLNEIHALRREMIFLRKSVWPLREIISSLARGESKLITDDVTLFLRDVYDHTIQVIDTIETFRDMISGMQDIYLSSVSNRMNEVMKVLTIIATIFIPMTFLAGIYGMNFKFMPELEWRWAYPALWVVLITLFVTMVAWFKRKRWL